MRSKRIQWLDFAKGLTIFSVVLIHQFPSRSFMEFILDIFAMPLFFAISGYLYKPTKTLHGYILMLYKKIISLGIPYILFTAFMLVLPNIHQGIIHYLMACIFHITVLPLGYLWFLYALFFIFIIVGTLNYFKIKLYIQVIIAVILLMLQMNIPTIIRGNYSPIKSVSGYLLCFYIGFLMKKYKFEVCILNRKFILTILTALWILLIICHLYFIGYGLDVDFFHYYDTFSKLISIPLFFAMFVEFPKNKFFKYFDKYGKYTLVIYLIHLPILSIPLFNNIRANLTIYDFPYHILLILFTWYMSILICYFAEKYKLINMVFYPRKYINILVSNTKYGDQLLK